MSSTGIDTSRFAELSALVTGGAGFIGSHLTERLVELGTDVTVLDDCSAGRRGNLRAVSADVEFVEGDVRDRETVREAVAGQDLVFHLAANAHVPTSVDRPRHDYEVNATGSQIVLEASIDADVERVVLASSAAVYGPPESVPMAETHPVNPISPYGASKLAAEKLGLAYDRTYELDVTALRIFNTYGPRQSRYVMYDFLRKLEADDSELSVLGSGEEVRTFVYVDDTVAAFLALALSEQAPGRPFNIGGNQETRILDLAERIVDRYYDGRPEVVTTGESKPGDISRLVVDNTRIRELGVEPTVGLSDGLDELYEWYHDSERTADQLAE